MINFEVGDIVKLKHDSFDDLPKSLWKAPAVNWGGVDLHLIIGKFSFADIGLITEMSVSTDTSGPFFYAWAHLITAHGSGWISCNYIEKT